MPGINYREDEQFPTLILRTEGEMLTLVGPPRVVRLSHPQRDLLLTDRWVQFRLTVCGAVKWEVRLSAEQKFDGRPAEPLDMITDEHPHRVRSVCVGSYGSDASCARQDLPRIMEHVSTSLGLELDAVQADDGLSWILTPQRPS